MMRILEFDSLSPEEFLNRDIQAEEDVSALGELLGELSLKYNRVRQSAITQEITEVSAGARAQRQRKE